MVDFERFVRFGLRAAVAILEGGAKLLEASSDASDVDDPGVTAARLCGSSSMFSHTHMSSILGPEPQPDVPDYVVDQAYGDPYGHWPGEREDWER